MSVSLHEHFFANINDADTRLKKMDITANGAIEKDCLFTFPKGYVGVLDKIKIYNEFSRLEVFDNYCQAFSDFLGFNIVSGKFRAVYKITPLMEVVRSEGSQHSLLCNISNESIRINRNLELSSAQGVILSKEVSEKDVVNNEISDANILQIELYPG